MCFGSGDKAPEKPKKAEFTDAPPVVTGNRKMLKIHLILKKITDQLKNRRKKKRRNC